MGWGATTPGWGRVPPILDNPDALYILTEYNENTVCGLLYKIHHHCELEKKTIIMFNLITNAASGISIYIIFSDVYLVIPLFMCMVS